MSENGHNHHRQEREEHNKKHHDDKPYWKRIHHTWSFWLFLFLMLAAIIYYMLSDNLSLRLRIKPQQAPLEEKKTWDPDFSKRKKIKAILDAFIPEFFVLVRLLGYTNVMWYDAGWSEWAAKQELPIEK